MTQEQLEQVRLSILRYTTAAERFASTRLLLQFLRAEGHCALTLRDIAQEIQYLIDKGLLARVEKVISPENATVRVTAAGRDFLAENHAD